MGYTREHMNLLSLKVDVFDLLQEGEMGKDKDLSKFVKKQMLVARQLGCLQLFWAFFSL